jgi:hypothetical protein
MYIYIFVYTYKYKYTYMNMFICLHVYIHFNRYRLLLPVENQRIITFWDFNLLKQLKNSNINDVGRRQPFID